MFRTLRSRFVAAFVGLTLGILLLVGYVINRSLHQHFEMYIQEKVRDRSAHFAVLLGQTYDNGWPQLALNDLTHWMLMEGLAARLIAPDGKMLWSSEESARQMGGHLPGPDSNALGPQFTVRMPVSSKGVQVATLEVGAGPGGLFTHHDLVYQQSVNQVLWIAAGIALLLSLLLGWTTARMLHRPLRQMTGVARSIQSGRWEERAPVAGAVELQQLGIALNHLAQSLEHQEAIRKRMTRDVAHELRTPLSILQSHLEAFQDGVWEPTPDRIALCHGEVLRLVRLVDDMNRLAEAEAEAVHAHPLEVELRPLLDSIASSVEPLFAKKGVGFRHESPPPIRLTVDPDHVRQIMLNLLDNARKFTPSGGETALHTTVTDDTVRIAVTDTGPGIPPEEIPFVFERLYRGDPSRSRRTGGAGLGLAIAQALAEGHGGRIEVESTAGTGSTFTLTLPRRPLP